MRKMSINNTTMPMNITDSSNPWERITKPASCQDCRLLRCSATLKYDHYYGVTYLGHYLYLLRFPSVVSSDDIEKLPIVSGCFRALLESSDGTYFRLSLQNETKWPIFKMLILMIIEETEKVRDADVHRLLSAIDRVMRRCCSFFREKKDDFTRNKAVGLLGELLLLRDYVIPVTGWNDALGCWKGPLGAPQDFVVKGTCVEVKTTEAGSRDQIEITSLDQLSPVVGDAYLHVIVLSKSDCDTAQSVSLRAVADELKEGFVKYAGDDEMFSQLLELVGYTPESHESIVNYQIQSRMFYLVGDDFPRITRATVPQGILSAKYTISLHMCAKFNQQPGWVK